MSRTGFGCEATMETVCRPHTQYKSTRTHLSAPTGFTGTVLSTGSIRWPWTDTSGRETGYKVYNATTGAVSQTVGAGIEEWLKDACRQIRVTRCMWWRTVKEVMSQRRPQRLSITRMRMCRAHSTVTGCIQEQCNCIMERRRHSV